MPPPRSVVSPAPESRSVVSPAPSSCGIVGYPPGCTGDTGGVFGCTGCTGGVTFCCTGGTCFAFFFLLPFTTTMMITTTTITITTIAMIPPIRNQFGPSAVSSSSISSGFGVGVSPLCAAERSLIADSIAAESGLPAATLSASAIASWNAFTLSSVYPSRLSAFAVSILD